MLPAMSLLDQWQQNTMAGASTAETEEVLIGLSRHAHFLFLLGSHWLYISTKTHKLLSSAFYTQAFAEVVGVGVLSVEACVF